MRRVNTEKKNNVVRSSLGISEPTSEAGAVFPIPISAAGCSADVMHQGWACSSVGRSGQRHVLVQASQAVQSVSSALSLDSAYPSTPKEEDSRSNLASHLGCLRKC